MKALLAYALTALIGCSCSSAAEPVTELEDLHGTGADAGHTGQDAGEGPLETPARKTDAGDASTIDAGDPSLSPRPVVARPDASASRSTWDAAADASPVDGVVPEAGADASPSADSGRTDLGHVVALHVSPPTIEWWGHTALRVSAELRSGETVDVSTEAVYESADPRVALVDEAGVVSTVSGGASRIVARYANVEAEVFVNVEHDPPRLYISPGPLQVPVGLSLPLTATASEGVTLEVTDVATWSSADETIATVEHGLVTGVSPGGTSIVATYKGSGASSIVTITDAEPVAIIISPNPSFVFAGSTQTLQLTSVIHFSDGTVWEGTGAVAWSSEDEQVATVTAAGEVSGVHSDQVRIVATFEGVSGTAEVSVYDPHPAGLVIDPGEASLGVDERLVIKAEVKLTDGTVRDISREVEWHTSVEDVVELMPNEEGTVAVAIGPGLVHVCAVFVGFESCAEITVLADAGTPKRDAGAGAPKCDADAP